MVKVGIGGPPTDWRPKIVCSEAEGHVVLNTSMPEKSGVEASERSIFFSMKTPTLMLRIHLSLNKKDVGILLDML